MARRQRRILPFRIPFFRIFYSTTYTILFLVCLVLLAITPATMIFRCFKSSAYQYIIMIGGVYFLTAVTAIFLYSSRLYTNRTTLAGVGKAYLPIEEDELGKSIRRMIVKHLERSAVIAWEASPRDLSNEAGRALRRASSSSGQDDGDADKATTGTEFPVDIYNPPWGDVRHDGWSSPSPSELNPYPNIQYMTVIEELPNLLEAKAVSFMAHDPAVAEPGEVTADAAVLDVLRRPANMDMATYLLQLSYLDVIDMSSVGEKFLRCYHEARFSPRPTSSHHFRILMQHFAELLDGMVALRGDVIDDIRLQTTTTQTSYTTSVGRYSASRASTNDTRSRSPVTARTRISRNTTPYTYQNNESEGSFRSVVHHRNSARVDLDRTMTQLSTSSASIISVPVSMSEVGSVIWRRAEHENG